MSNKIFKKLVIFDRFFNSGNVSFNIILLFCLIDAAVAVLFYPLIPIILNYGPGIIEGGYEAKWTGISYLMQYIFTISLVIISGSIFLQSTLKSINNWNRHGISNEELERIRHKCINLPYIIFIVQIILPLLTVILLHTILRTPVAFVFQTCIIIFAFVTVMSVILHIFAKRIFTNILVKTYKNQESSGFRLGLVNKIFIQIIPMFLMAILLTSLIGYSRLIKDKGDIIFRVYQNKLEELALTYNVKNADITSNDDLLKTISGFYLNDVRSTAFIADTSGTFKTINGNPPGRIFKNYMYDLSMQYGGQVYDVTGEIRGAVVKINGDNGYLYAGIMYEVASNEALAFFIGSVVILILLNILVLYYFSRSLSADISSVARSLFEIAEGRSLDMDIKLAITSNDEISDLVQSFNKIQEREKENIRSIKESQSILREQDRLASLGQLAGGIAHNLRTPIMSLAGGIEGLMDLTEEYKDSIEDKTVTPKDHLEIAAEMKDWLNKMKPYCSYMSDIITAIKGQAVQSNTSSYITFTVDEVIKRIDLLMKHELKKYHCTLNTDFQIDDYTELKGDVNNLVQIFDNIIINAIHSYEGKSGIIDFRIIYENENVLFSFTDYGKGIKESIKNRLFKEMVTTKGKDGTGLGLYISYSTIKGKFNGNMWFDSEPGKGTTFYISIPLARVINKR